MESYKVRGITYQEEIVSKKDIRRGVKNILDFDDESPNRKTKVVRRTVIEEGGRKKRKKKKDDDDDEWYYDYDYETTHYGGGKRKRKRNKKWPGDEWEWETFYEYGPNGEEIEIKKHGDIEEYWT